MGDGTSASHVSTQVFHIGMYLRSMIKEVRSLEFIIYVTPGFQLGGVGEFTSYSEVVTMSCSEHCSSCAQYSWIGKIESRKGERVGESIKSIIQNQS